MYYETRTFKNSDPETMWEYASRYVGWPSKCGPSSVIYNGQRLHDQKEVANAINFSLVKRISESIPQTNTDPLSFTRDRLGHIFPRGVPKIDLMEPVTFGMVKTAVKGLKNLDTTGPDNLNTRTLKKLRHPSSYTRCLSFSQGIYPRSHKVAKIFPLYKGKECDPPEKRFELQMPQGSNNGPSHISRGHPQKTAVGS